MDRNFAQASQLSLRKLPCPTFVVLIDGRPIVSGNIVEESEPIQVVPRFSLRFTTRSRGTMGTNLQLVTNQVRNPLSLYRGELGKRVYSSFTISGRCTHLLCQEERWITSSGRGLPAV
jgi:Rieske Fe-S protein